MPGSSGIPVSPLSPDRMRRPRRSPLPEEYARALELDPKAFANMEEQGIAGQPSGADRGRLYCLMAKLYASRGDLERALALLQKARELGYQSLDNAYRDREFVRLWNDGRLAQVVRGGRR